MSDLACYSVSNHCSFTVVGTAANVNDVTQAGALLHGEETEAFGDAGYRGVDKREEAQGPHWDVAMQPGKRKQSDPTRQWAQLLSSKPNS